MNDNLYHIVTHSDDSGWDEKIEARTRKEAFDKAKECLQDPDYDGVKIYHKGILIRQFSAIYVRKIINYKPI